MKTLTRINSTLNGVANIVAVVFIFVMMALITADVAGRYLFNSPVKGTYEIGTMLLVACVFFALAYAQRTNQHVRVEILTRALPPRLRLHVETFVYIISFIVMCGLTYVGVNIALASWNMREFTQGAINVPMYPGKAVIPIGAFLFSLQLLVNIITNLARSGAVEAEVKQ